MLLCLLPNAYNPPRYSKSQIDVCTGVEMKEQINYFTGENEREGGMGGWRALKRLLLALFSPREMEPIPVRLWTMTFVNIVIHHIFFYNLVLFSCIFVSFGIKYELGNISNTLLI